jgi:hypothetical protein
VIDELVADASNEEQITGHGGLLGQLTKRIEHRGKVEPAAVVIVVVVFLLATGARSFDEDLGTGQRGQLYGSLAGTSGALLGFVLAALAILVALPAPSGWRSYAVIVPGRGCPAATSGRLAPCSTPWCSAQSASPWTAAPSHGLPTRF